LARKIQEELATGPQGGGSRGLLSDREKERTDTYFAMMGIAEAGIDEGVTEDGAKAFPRLPAQGVSPEIVAVPFGCTFGDVPMWKPV
jgi:hypothetical protein